MYDFFYELLYNQIKMFYDVYDSVVGYVFKKPVLPLIENIDPAYILRPKRKTSYHEA